MQEKIIIGYYRYFTIQLLSLFLTYLYIKPGTFDISYFDPYVNHVADKLHQNEIGILENIITARFAELRALTNSHQVLAEVMEYLWVYKLYIF